MSMRGTGGPQDISGAVTSVIIRFIRGRAGAAGVANALAAAGEHRPVPVLEDSRSWSTHEEALALFAAAAQVTGVANVGRHVGEEMLRQHDGPAVADLLRPLGSPAELLGNVTTAAATFTTVSSLELLEVGEANAVVRALTRLGLVRHPYLCEFTHGLLSQVPVFFGLGPAVVTETECQARGGRFCLYNVAWQTGTWRPFADGTTALRTVAQGHQGAVPTDIEDGAQTHIALLEGQLRQMADRLEQVFSTASDLLSDEDLPELLATITHRAAGAVQAPRYLLVVHTAPDEALQLYHHGLDEEEARALATELWRTDPNGTDDADGSRLVVDIASSRQRYGRLAAIYPPGTELVAREREIFSLYANYAATALDLVTSLAESRRSHATARALLDFSRALSRVGTVDDVSQTLAETVPAVTGCGRSSVMLWDPLEQKLVLKALSDAGQRQGATGGDERAGGDDLAYSVSAADTPIISDLMTSRDIVVVDPGVPDPFLSALFQEVGIAYSVLAPLVSDDEFLGVVAADFLDPWSTDPRTDADLQERLRALADQAVTAFQNASLLEQVGHMAWHDALTGLPNRRLLEDRVRQELERAERAGEPPTMFFVDLDRFKKVNDTLGHAAGDDLLCQAAQRLCEVVRRQDTVARLGGDEFAVLLPGLADMVAVRQLAGRMLDSLHQPYRIGGTEVSVSASIGIARYPEHGDSYDDLLNRADRAMYQAKSLGRNTFSIYTEQVGETPGGAWLGADLLHSVERDELFVLYHPYVDLQTGQIVGVEALVRWRHPTRGVIEPVAFIRQAAESDVILGIDEFVVREVARQMRTWIDRGLAPLRVSVNVSGRDLLHPGFADMVMASLRRHVVPPEWFEIEITGRIEIDSGGMVQRTVEKLRIEGVRFSVDDFGTGASTLEQVTAFSVRTIKIDRSCVQMPGPAGELSASAAAVIAMADQLGLDCVAEGVETPHQRQVLLQQGCTTAQGFLFSPPLPPVDVERMLRVQTTTPEGMAWSGAVASGTAGDGTVPADGGRDGPAAT